MKNHWILSHDDWNDDYGLGSTKLKVYLIVYVICHIFNSAKSSFICFAAAAHSLCIKIQYLTVI